MQVTVTDYKTDTKGEKITVDTEKVRSIYSGIAVFDGRSTEGWFVLLEDKDGTNASTILVDKDDVKAFRTVK